MKLLRLMIALILTSIASSCMRQDITIESSRSESSTTSSSSNPSIAITLGGRLSSDGKVTITPIKEQVVSGGGVEIRLGISQ